MDLPAVNTDLGNALDAKQPAGIYATGTGTADGTNTGDQDLSGYATGDQDVSRSSNVSFANVTANGNLTVNGGGTFAADVDLVGNNLSAANVTASGTVIGETIKTNSDFTVSGNSAHFGTNDFGGFSWWIIWSFFSRQECGF